MWFSQFVMVATMLVFGFDIQPGRSYDDWTGAAEVAVAVCTASVGATVGELTLSGVAETVVFGVADGV